MAVSLILIPAILASLHLFLPQINALFFLIDHQTPSSCSHHHNQDFFACELEEAKLKIALLESIFEERIRDVNARSQYLRDCENKIELLTGEIDRLRIKLSSFEDDYSRANQKINALEEEVRLLWAASRKNNFEIHDLEYKALDAEKRLKEAAAQIGEMEEIVSEQWIQIQQLEQAVYMAEMRTSNIRKELWRRCPYVKYCISLLSRFMETSEEILDTYVPRDWLIFCKSQVLTTFSSAKHLHHQLQDYVKHVMRSNEFTSALAHEEVVFFVLEAAVALQTKVLALSIMNNSRKWISD